MNCPHGVDVDEECEGCNEWVGQGFELIAGIARCDHPQAAEILKAENEEVTGVSWCPGCGAILVGDDWQLPFGVKGARKLDDEMQAAGTVRAHPRGDVS